MAEGTGRSGVDVAIIGAGVVGLNIALRLRADARQVTLIDPAPDAGGTAWGSAGTIADYAVIPVGTPSVLRNLPALLLGRDSPLSIRRAALFSLAPWLARFAWQSLPGNSRRNAERLARLVAEAPSAWRDLAAEISIGDLVRHQGCLYAYGSQAAFRAAASDIALRRSHGVVQELLSPDETAALEPALPRFEGGSLFFPDSAHLADPGVTLSRLRRAVEASGARLVTAAAERLERTNAGVELAWPGGRLTAKTVVVAAGAWSKPLAAQAGDAIPLDTERGC